MRDGYLHTIGISDCVCVCVCLCLCLCVCNCKTDYLITLVTALDCLLSAR